MENVIFHIDVNSAFLSWEAVYRLQNLNEKIDLREIPSAVCGDITKRHGIILAKSIPAKKYGVKTAETIGDALKKCPELKLVDAHHDLYRQYSNAFMRILEEYTPDIEKASIDEAYMDMTGTQSLWGEPIEVANKIKDRIYSELGFTVNVGISNNKLLAKMASDFEKPNRVHTLFSSEIEQKMWHLPVGDLFCCGKSTQKKLNDLGIRTIGELAKTDSKILISHLKKQGEVIWNFANGIDTSMVETIEQDSKGYGNSTTLSFDIADAVMAKQVLMSLCENVCARIRKDGAKISVVAVSIRTFDLSNTRHQTTLFAATDITNEVYLTACKLFDELWDGQTAIRLLGVHTSHVSFHSTERQLDLFNSNRYEKYEKLDAAVDFIKKKYGETSIMRASHWKDCSQIEQTSKHEKDNPE